MVQSHAHSHDHDGHAHTHTHVHAHGAASPHPAQTATWSILRMDVGSRLAAAIAVSAVLWAIVWLAMR
jgi:H+/gluconate symporter-like permease